MPLVLSEHNISEMTDEELLELVVETYAEKHNWEAYEKDFDGSGRLATIKGWGFRDQGAYARMALEILQQRRAARCQPLTQN